jgi:hypothetical protein
VSEGAAAAYGRPYKGPQSYQAEDGELFFGRERAAAQLVATVLSHRVSLLVARSAAGKTSLLNARAMPELEARGWPAVRILPHDDPCAAARYETLRALLPPPAAERAALARACAALQLGPRAALGELLEAYDRLARRDPRRRLLLAPVQPRAAAGETLAAQLPYLCRVLRSSLELRAFEAQLRAYLGTGGAPPALHEGSALGELDAVLGSPELVKGHAELVGELELPAPDLASFFSRLAELYGSRLPRFALVLVFDQFEELFTRFADPGPVARERAGPLPDWRLREKFFRELQRLHAARRPHAPRHGEAEPGGAALPLRVLISLREEYLARLEPLAPLLAEGCQFSLGLLQREEAREALLEPARCYGYDYAPACAERLIEQLTSEGQYVLPAHLQVVCEKLWQEFGAALAAPHSPGQSAPQIQIEQLESLGASSGILRTYFAEFLALQDEADALETLEILEYLITASGTRNIAELGQLLRAPFRDPERRRRLIGELESRAIVRVEARLGGLFAEIVHEFLIGPILEQLRERLQRHPGYVRFRQALRSLELLAPVRPDQRELLSAQEFAELHAERARLSWPDWAVECMLRSAIARGAAPEAQLEWAQRLAQLQTRELAQLRAELQGSGPARRLDRAELALAWHERESLELGAERLELLLRSAIENGDPDDPAPLRYWLGRYEA